LTHGEPDWPPPDLRTPNVRAADVNLNVTGIVSADLAMVEATALDFGAFAPNGVAAWQVNLTPAGVIAGLTAIDSHFGGEAGGRHTRPPEMPESPAELAVAVAIEFEDRQTPRWIGEPNPARTRKRGARAVRAAQSN